MQKKILKKIKALHAINFVITDQWSSGQSLAGQVAVYSIPGAYFSADNGVTWKEAPASVYLSDVSFVSASLIYGLTEGGLEKSTDGGVSWSYVSKFDATFSSVTRIFFEDEQHGLAY